MKTLRKSFSLLIAALMLTGYASYAQTASANNNSKTSNQTQMKTYLIERNILNAGKLSHEELKAISRKSCSVLNEMGPDIQWVQSYVGGDKIYCVYKATSEELLREHGLKGGFPVDHIYEVENIISPATATAQ